MLRKTSWSPRVGSRRCSCSHSDFWTRETSCSFRARGTTRTTKRPSSAGPTLVNIRTTSATNFTLTADLVREYITPRSKVLVLINPGNPTGTVIPPDEVVRICEVARQHDLLVVSDEIYARITFEGHTVQPVAPLPGMQDRNLHPFGVLEGLRHDRLADRLFCWSL